LPNPAAIAAPIQAADPDAIHIATEGTKDHMTRAYCLKRGCPFTTSYTIRFPEYSAARAPIPLGLSYAILRRLHAAATFTMVSTQELC
jgi:hypothetical protein